ncbi:MAG: hypothetical protein KDB27_03730 [Planctomycetales bacterium]|nr:hypothetical protein [Planctomycetales bacterium]
MLKHKNNVYVAIALSVAVILFANVDAHADDGEVLLHNLTEQDCVDRLGWWDDGECLKLWIDPPQSSEVTTLYRAINNTIRVLQSAAQYEIFAIRLNLDGGTYTVYAKNHLKRPVTRQFDSGALVTHDEQPLLYLLLRQANQSIHFL